MENEGRNRERHPEPVPRRGATYVYCGHLRCGEAGRRRRSRTWLTTIGVVVAVGAAGATAPLWLNRPTAPPAASTCDSQFDPLTYEIDTSGVVGYQLTATTTSTYWQLAGLHDPASGFDVQVILYACGGQPYLLDGTGPVDPAAGESADQVINGQPAYWLPPNDARTPLGLAWQWTPGAWAIVSPGSWEHPLLPPGGGGPDDLRAAARRVAAQLNFGAGTRVTAPLALPAPDGTYPAVISSQFAYDNGRQFPIGYGIGFDELGTDPPTHSGGYTPYLELRATPFAAVDDLPRSATPYPEDLGYPAYSVPSGRTSAT